jgi:hypothetical protein
MSAFDLKQTAANNDSVVYDNCTIANGPTEQSCGASLDDPDPITGGIEARQGRNGPSGPGSRDPLEGLPNLSAPGKADHDADKTGRVGYE